ncbi:MAG: anion transporter [Phycisphaeraceae bacterium]|nr:anion transporter [Phycisphaeraceae bacterium]
MDRFTLLVFIFVYLAMFLGRVPGLQLDRTGAALIGAIALLVGEKLSPQQAWQAVDVPTISLLFGMMVVSAQLRLGGFYAAVTRRLASVEVSPPTLLALLIIVAGSLSAILANDIVCLAMTPVLLEGCVRRGLNPLPYLLGLACAANVGSAATLIGNPQNILIGETLRLSFACYLAQALVPALLGLAVVWLVIRFLFKNRWQATVTLNNIIPSPPLDPWQAAKGLGLTAVLMGVFLFSPWPRDVTALAAAGLLLMSRKMHSRAMLSLVDWQLIVLFIALFVVNQALATGGILTQLSQSCANVGLDLPSPLPLFLATPVLSNIVSNVPAVMLLLPSATHPLAGPILALSSTLAGNLLIVGSIANIIVVTLAADMGYKISWRDHVRVGLPVTVLTLAIAGGWLWLVAAASS